MTLILWKFKRTIENGEGLCILKRMLSETQNIKDAAQHPNVYFEVYVVFQISIVHLWWSVHEGGVLGEFFKLTINIFIFLIGFHFGHFTPFQEVRAKLRRTKISDFEL